MGFKEDIQKLVIKINERMPYINNEEQTKQSLIIPFIDSLGYDTGNPLEVIAEFTTDYGEKIGARVDYAILKEEKPIIFIKAKPLNSIITNIDSHLAYFFNSNNEVKLGIMTNGIEYQFFTDLKDKNKMDDIPFYKLSLSDLKESDIDVLSCFKKDNYDKEKLSKYAETFLYASEFNASLKTRFICPSNEFVRFLIKKY